MTFYFLHQEVIAQYEETIQRYRNQLTEERRNHQIEMQRVTMAVENMDREMKVSCLKT
jgi:hypothetical protein